MELKKNLKDLQSDLLIRSGRAEEVAVLWMNVAVQAKPRDHQGLKIEVIEPSYRDGSY